MVDAKKIFDEFDSDKRGYLNRKEIPDAVRCCGLNRLSNGLTTGLVVLIVVVDSVILVVVVFVAVVDVTVVTTESRPNLDRRLSLDQQRLSPSCIVLAAHQAQYDTVH